MKHLPLPTYIIRADKISLEQIENDQKTYIRAMEKMVRNQWCWVRYMSQFRLLRQVKTEWPTSRNSQLKKNRKRAWNKRDQLFISVNTGWSQGSQFGDPKTFSAENDGAVLFVNFFNREERDIIHVVLTGIEMIDIWETFPSFRFLVLNFRSSIVKTLV